MSVAIRVDGLKKTLGGRTVFENFNCVFLAGEITAIFGPNGSGKSTLLNTLSGLVSADGGAYEIVGGLDSFRFSYVFQNYRETLLPWRNNFRNLAFPLELQGKDEVDIRERIRHLETLFKIRLPLQSFPYELSGGQQQILALLRALMVEPRLIFLDEPFSALDYENALKMRQGLQAYYLEHRPTIVMVSHNLEEAVFLSRRILIFSRKPTRVVETIENALPYPRTLETFKTASFEETKNKTLSAFAQVSAL